ncbi:MAG: type II toxin-antitoxin system PemK/MazF family toxin [Flavobacteriales bacterium]|nr:type II toxin-antitoxin system PemK/MazF family toxin [Flavobacteriales bacterium]
MSSSGSSQVSPGSVVAVDLGLPPATKGREIQKHRPCVVLTHMKPLGLLIVVPISGGSPVVMAFTNVQVPANKQTGLTKVSYAQVHQIRVVADERIGRRHGVLGAMELGMIKVALRRLLGL